MEIEVVKNPDGTITIVKNKVKECDCSLERVLSQKSKLENILLDFDVRVDAQKAKIVADFEAQMSKVKAKYDSQLAEVETVLQKAVAAGCVLPE